MSLHCSWIILIQVEVSLLGCLVMSRCINNIPPLPPIIIFVCRCHVKCIAHEISERIELQREFSKRSVVKQVFRGIRELESTRRGPTGPDFFLAAPLWRCYFTTTSSTERHSFDFVTLHFSW
ncbi:hypothetical protein K474DRAFT_804723 [Panus rudis PR-1116 ss-1]|nr:hypothetical protein K474DRAFT_804723 [Panus rudis PR-1116 ss-1]